jgi:hypothetical protein
MVGRLSSFEKRFWHRRRRRSPTRQPPHLQGPILVKPLKQWSASGLPLIKAASGLRGILTINLKPASFREIYFQLSSA